MYQAILDIPHFACLCPPNKLIITSSEHISSASIWQITSICIYWPCSNDAHKISSHLLEFSATRNFLRWCYSRKFYPPKFYYLYLLLKIKPHAYCICIHTVPPSYLPREEALKKWQILGLISPNARWKLWIKFFVKIYSTTKTLQQNMQNWINRTIHIKVPWPATALVKVYRPFESHMTSLPWRQYCIIFVFTKFTYYKQVFLFLYADLRCRCGL